MADANTVAFSFKGLNFQLDPLAIPEDSYRLGINVRLDRQAISQRHGVREIPLRSDTDGLVEEFQALNLQGAIAYSPSRGQSALQFASKGDYIAISAAGRKFLIEVVGRGPSAYANLAEITGTAVQAPDLHMNWMAQAENYLIAGDDFGSTYIFDGADTAFLSEGYNPVNREASRVPNRARLPVYTHGRLAIVRKASSSLLGDIIHGTVAGETNAADLLNFTEQTYWAEGAELTLPTNAGPILASYTLPRLGRASDHGEYVLEGEERVVAFRSDVYPRTAWIDTPNMVVTVSAEGGARGPWAFDVYSDDAIRRTLNGLQTLSFARRTSDLIYTPQESISQSIDEFLEGDYGPLLRFNQTKVHRRAKRLYTTVRPWISGYHWKHRGVATFNYLKKVWEGINIYPESIQDVKMFVPVRMSGEARMFMLAGNDRTGAAIRVLEVETDLREDVLTDGTHPIQSAIYTRAVYGDLKEMITVEEGSLQFDEVLGEVDWEVLWKSDWSQGCWTRWNGGQVCRNPISSPGVKNAKLGTFNGKEVNGVRVKSGRHFEFLVRWSGKADLRFHSVDVSRHPDTQRSILDETGDCDDDSYCCENADPLFLWQP